MKTIDLNRLQSEVIQVMRFPLIILVVFVHMLPFEQKSIQWNGTSMDIYVLISELISHHIGRLAVPFFFLFSGYFFFFKVDGWSRSLYVEQLKKRVNSLLIPFVIWNALYIVAVFLKNWAFIALGWQAEEAYRLLYKTSLYQLFWGMPVNYPLWYLRDLIAMTLLTPLYYYFFRFSGIYGLVILLVAYLCVLEADIPGLSTTAIFYFGAGAYFALHKKNLLRFAMSFGKVCGICAIVALGITTYYTNTSINEYVVRVFVLFAMPSVFFICYNFLYGSFLKSKLAKFAETVFFIYATHLIYILNWLKGGVANSFLAKSGWGMLTGYFVTPIICIVLLILLYAGLKKFLPNTLSYITGNRGN